MVRLRGEASVSRSVPFWLGLAVFALAVSFPRPGAPRASESEGVELAGYRGKVLVIDFWASWCVPCRRSFPWLEEMHKKYAGDGLVVIGINEDDDAQDAAAFLDAYPVSFRIVSDVRGDLARRFDLLAMPSSYVIDRDGEIAARHLGFRSARKAEYEATLRKLLYPDSTTGERADLTTTN